MSKQKTTYTPLAWRYGITNGFSTLLTTMATTYWAIFLTGSVGMSNAMMGSILTASSLADLISLPICGIILQKVRVAKGKYGLFRPWLLIGGVLAALFRWLTFTDLGLTGTAQALWFGISYVLCYVFFNMAFSAFTGILPLMAKGADRVAFASARTTCNSIGKFLFSISSVTLVSLFGQGNDTLGYCLLAALIAILTALGFGQLFFAAKDYDKLEEHPGAANGKKDKYDVSMWEMLKCTVTGPFILYLLGAICKGSMFFVITGLAPYYYTYVVGDKSMLTLFMSASTFLMIISSYLTPYVSRLCKGSRNTYVTGIAVYGACLALAYFSGTNATVFTIFMSVGYVGYAVAHASEVAFYSNIVDYTKWKHNRDLRPFMMTLFSLTPKAATTIGSAVLGFGLAAVGFDKANVTPAAANGVRVLLSGLPALLAVGCVVFCMLCPMSEKRVAQIQADIEARELAEEK